MDSHAAPKGLGNRFRPAIVALERNAGADRRHIGRPVREWAADVAYVGAGAAMGVFFLLTTMADKPHRRCLHSPWT